MLNDAEGQICPSQTSASSPLAETLSELNPYIPCLRLNYQVSLRHLSFSIVNIYGIKCFSTGWPIATLYLLDNIPRHNTPTFFFLLGFIKVWLYSKNFHDIDETNRRIFEVNWRINHWDSPQHFSCNWLKTRYFTFDKWSLIHCSWISWYFRKNPDSTKNNICISFVNFSITVVLYNVL